MSRDISSNILLSEFMNTDLDSIRRLRVSINVDKSFSDDEIEKIKNNHRFYDFINIPYDTALEVKDRFGSNFVEYYIKDAEKYDFYDLLDKFGSDLHIPDEKKLTLFDLPRVEKDKRKYIKYLIDDTVFSKNDGKYMSNEDILDYVDYVAKEIAKNTKDDIGKVVLLDKFIRNNFRFETDYSRINDEYNSLPSHERLSHPMHYLDNLLKNNYGVCSAIASFATLVLSHPAINIPVCECSDSSVINDHVWNDVCIDGKWYTVDFSHSMWLDRNNSHKFILKKLRSNKIDTKKYREEDRKSLESIDLDKCDDYDRNILNNIYSEFYYVDMKKPNMVENIGVNMENNNKNKTDVSVVTEKLDIENEDNAINITDINDDMISDENSHKFNSIIVNNQEGYLDEAEEEEKISIFDRISSWFSDKRTSLKTRIHNYINSIKEYIYDIRSRNSDDYEEVIDNQSVVEDNSKIEEVIDEQETIEKNDIVENEIEFDNVIPTEYNLSLVKKTKELKSLGYTREQIAEALHLEGDVLDDFNRREDLIQKGKERYDYLKDKFSDLNESISEEEKEVSQNNDNAYYDHEDGENNDLVDILNEMVDEKQVRDLDTIQKELNYYVSLRQDIYDRRMGYGSEENPNQYDEKISELNREYVLCKKK